MTPVIKKVYLILLILISSSFIVSPLRSFGYSESFGVQYGDEVEVSCTTYADGVQKNQYTDSSPLLVTIDPDVNNENFIKHLVGMKLNEIKAVISWYVTQVNGTVNFFEYKNVKIVNIVFDSSPNPTGPTAGKVLLTILGVILGVGAGIVAIYGGVFIYKRSTIKRCIGCSSPATSKCAKCGEYHCPNCSTKGCKKCGSKKYIRL